MKELGFGYAELRAWMADRLAFVRATFTLR